MSSYFDSSSSSHHNGLYQDSNRNDWDSIANTTLGLSQNVTLTANAGETITPADIVYDILAFCALLAFCVCTRSRIPDERYRLAAAERRARYLAREERIQRMSDPTYRQELVLRALVVKRVTQEQDGQLTLGDAEGDDDDGDSLSGASHSIDSSDENVSTCVICLEAFRVGDVVAWSRTSLESDSADTNGGNRTETCNHVFHRDCIVGWLMHSNEMHDACPSCRAAIVHEDTDDDEEDEENDDLFPEGGPSAAFVIMHGLVSRVRRASYSLIGQSIDIDDPDNEDIETGHVPPKAPPSPMRRVFSLEASPLHGRRRSSLRRRPSSSSIRSSRESYSTVDGNDDDDDDDNLPPPPPRRRALSISPLVLRRVVSDLARAPLIVPLARESSGGSRSLLPRSRGDGAYQRVSSVGSESSERSTSEISIFEDEDEEDIIVRQVSLPVSSYINQSLSDPTDEEEQGFVE